MIVDQQATNVPMAVFHLGMLAQFRAMNPKQNMDSILSAELTGPFQSLFQQGNDTTPSFYYGGNNSRKILYVDGVRSVSQALNLTNGYNNSAQIGGFNPTNFWFSNAADNVVRTLSNGHFADPEYLDTVGYSAGGAVGSWFAYNLKNAGATYKMKVVTFGAPRAFNVQQAAFLNTLPIARWMCDDDPVPLVPPRITDCPALIAIQSALSIIRWGNYVHTVGGINVNLLGQTNAAALPTAAALNPSTSLSAWLLGQEDDASSPHAIEEYRRRLTLCLQLLPDPQRQNVGEAPVETTRPIPSREANAVQRAHALAVMELGANQNKQEVVQPDGNAFQAVQLGKIWCVSFGGKIICEAPIKKRARHIARVGNEMLRSLPKQAIVDPGQFVEQMTTWFALATDPTSGFAPTINTELP